MVCAVVCSMADDGAAAGEFVRELTGSFKSSVVMGKFQRNVHVLLTSASVQKFDEKVANFASGPRVWCDVGGQVASQLSVFLTVWLLYVVPVHNY